MKDICMYVYVADRYVLSVEGKCCAHLAKKGELNMVLGELRMLTKLTVIERLQSS